MDSWLDSAQGLVGPWGWIVALVVLFVVIYKTGFSGSGRSASAGFGCLAAVVITLLFFAIVIF